MLVSLTLLLVNHQEFFDKWIKVALEKGFYKYDPTKDKISNEAVKDSEYIATSERIFDNKKNYKEVPYTFVSDLSDDYTGNIKK